MDMIRWLATNKVVLAVWGLGILAILLASIFGGSKEVAVEAPEANTVVESTAEVTKPLAVAAVATTAAATSAVVADTSASSEAVAEAAVTAGAVEAASTEVVDSAAITEDLKAEVSAESVETSSDESNLAGTSNDDLLMMAREAYWDNGLDKAASLYSELIDREPSVFEHKGELGNVFWRQGYPKKAAELYADIAEPMISGGNGERVSNMVGFIGLFFPERAANIRALLDAQ